VRRDLAPQDDMNRHHAILRRQLIRPGLADAPRVKHKYYGWATEPKKRPCSEFVKVTRFVSAGFDFMAKSRATTPPKDYESALAELESIVGEMESGQLPLEASLAAYKRGAVLLHYCRQQLTEAEQQVKILENGAMVDFTTVDFKAGQPFKTEDIDD
jgi:exodeoxyribonuclease VII small subunit